MMLSEKTETAEEETDEETETDMLFVVGVCREERLEKSVESVREERVRAFEKIAKGTQLREMLFAKV